LDIVWVLAVMTFAAFVQSVGGFGFALMAVPLAAIAVDLPTAVVVVSIGALFNVVILCWRTRHEVDRGLAIRFNVPAVLGMPFGLMILTNVDQRSLKIALGLVIIVATIALMRGWSSLEPSVAMDVIAGATSGVLSTATGTNGPPLVIASQIRRLAAPVFRATLAFSFAVSGAITLVLYVVAGLVTRREVMLASAAVPLILFGQFLGLKLQTRFAGSRFDRLVSLLLLASGVSVGVSGVWG
jgi:uncharacterized membrane protein YfcA